MMEGKEPHGGGADVRILVIDDEEIVHASVGKILWRAGYSAIEAVFSAQEGLERLRRERYDLIITDLMMPQMNGVELLRTLRQEGIRVPALMITGYPTIRTALEAMRYGAMDYLAKPFTRKELLGPVSRALKKDLPADGGAAPSDLLRAPSMSEMVPGAVVFLPRHSWACYQRDGMVQVGLEESFLDAVGKVACVVLPAPMDTLEQGTMGIHIIGENGEEHMAASPLSGQVMAINREAANDPALLTAGQWLVSLLPSDLAGELGHLVKK